MFPISMLALEAADAGVVVTSITLVFAMLVALCLLITLEGKFFSGQKPAPKAAAAPKAAPAPKAVPQAAPAPKAAVPAADGSIPGEIVAAIAAAVACLEGEGAVIRGIRRVQGPASRRGAWGEAGVREHTTPFM